MAAIELPRLKSKQNLVIKKERTRIININSSKLEEIIYSIWPEVAIAANFCGSTSAVLQTRASVIISYWTGPTIMLWKTATGVVRRWLQARVLD